MNILIVSDVFPPKCGGVGWAAFYLAKALQKRGHKVEVVTAFGQSNNVEGLIVHQAPSFLTKQWAHWFVRQKIKNLLRTQKWDVINAHNLIAVRASVGFSVPVVSMVHDFWPVDFRGSLFDNRTLKNQESLSLFGTWKAIWDENGFFIKLASVPIAIFMKARTLSGLRALRKSQAIAYNSKFVQEMLSKQVPSVPQAVWYNICAPDVDYDKIPVINFAKPTVLYVGKFTKQKGAHLLVEVARLLPEVDVMMVQGTKEELPNNLPSNVKVRPYLPQEELFSYMKSADVFVMPSLWNEPFGRTLVEAMAMGAPCVASRRGGIASDIIVHEENGILVDPPTPEQFAQVIRGLLKDNERRKKIGETARKDFLERFNQKIIVKECEQLLKHVEVHPE